MWPTPAVFDTTGGPYPTELTATGFRSYHNGVPHGTKLSDAVRALGDLPGSDDTVNRTHRLKALGNGIVPSCAVPFALAIRDLLERYDAR